MSEVATDAIVSNAPAVIAPASDAMERFKLIQNQLLSMGSGLKEKLDEFNQMKSEMENIAQEIGIETPNIPTLSLEIVEPGFGRASKFWGISRIIETMLLSYKQVITRFTLEELKEQLPEDLQDVPDSTLHQSMWYLKTKFTRVNNYPAHISLLALPRNYGIEYVDGEYRFYNYQHLSVTQGVLTSKK